MARTGIKAVMRRLTPLVFCSALVGPTATAQQASPPAKWPPDPPALFPPVDFGTTPATDPEKGTPAPPPTRFDDERTFRSVTGEMVMFSEHFGAVSAAAPGQDAPSTAPTKAADRRLGGGFPDTLEDFDKDIRRFNAALRKNPDDVGALIGRAGSYFGYGLSEKALADLEHAIRLRPESAPARRLRGMIRHNRREYSAAIEDFTFVLERSPDELYARTGRFVCWFELRDYAAALGDGDLVVIACPNDPNWLYYHADVLAHLGQADRAIADLDRALVIRPDFVRALGLRGYSRMHLGDLEGAIADFSAYLKADPDSSHVLCRRSAALTRMGRHEEALLDADRAIALDSGISDPSIVRASAGLSQDHEELVAAARTQRDSRDAVRARAQQMAMLLVCRIAPEEARILIDLYLARRPDSVLWQGMRATFARTHATLPRRS